MDLFPYQVIGANFLASRRRALLLDAPGLGKTGQALKAADMLDIRNMETICPASVVTQWRGNHADISESGYEFDSRSYESARDKAMPPKMGVLTLDEIHYCGNHNARRTTAILGSQHYGTDGVINDAEYVWGLSGTPSPRDPSRLFPILNAVVPGALTMPSGRRLDYWQFKNRFCVMYDSGKGMVVREGKNLEELAEMMAPYVLRRTKKQVMPEWKEPLVGKLMLDAGEARDMLLKADLEPEGRLVAEVFAKRGFEGLKELAETEHKGVSRYRRYCGMLTVLPVVEWLMDQFDSGMEKVVLICVHREVVEALQQKLKERGIEAVIFYGGMSDKAKDKSKMDFINRKDVRGFIGQIVSCGTGLDGLQAATGDMVLVEYSWISDDNYQVICRLDRIGQSNPVLARFVGIEGSLSGAIMATAERRAAEQIKLYG